MKRIVSLFFAVTFLAMALLCASSCSKKTALEVLVYLQENALDNLEYSNKLKEFEVYTEQNEWKLTHESAIVKATVQLGLSEKDSGDAKYTLSRQDIAAFIESYSVEELFLLFQKLDRYVDKVNYRPLMLCVEACPDAFVKVFELKENIEGYYTENTEAAPITRAEPLKEDASLIETYDVKYYGDYAIEEAKRYIYSSGKLGWENGVFHDVPASYYARYYKYLYYKGEKIANFYTQCTKYPDNNVDYSVLSDFYTHVGEKTGKVYFLYRDGMKVEMRTVIGVIG